MTVTVMHMRLDIDREKRLSVSLPLGDEKREEAALRLLQEDGYVVVAKIDGDDLDYAYQATQNGVLSPSWSMKPPSGVTPIGEGSFMIDGKKLAFKKGVIRTEGRELGYKSSEVGDVFVLNGAAYVVDTFGFTPIEGYPPTAPKP